MKKSIYLLIGMNIKKYRLKKHYTIEEFSAISQIDIEYLKSIEKCGVNGDITFDILNKICIYLDIEMINLFNK